MKAVVYKGPEKVHVEEVEDPKIQAPTDALLKVAICGSDLHMYEGRSIAPLGTTFGHEIPQGCMMILQCFFLGGRRANNSKRNFVLKGLHR
jgi:hypothetical protein